MSPTTITPINTGYVAELDKIRAALSADRRGSLSAVVTTEGVSATLAARPWGGLQVEGWAQRQWGAGGWAAGARVSYSW